MAAQLLEWSEQPHFVNRLKRAPILDARRGGRYTLALHQGLASLGIVDPATGQPLQTPAWQITADQASALAPNLSDFGGPTILVKSKTPIQVQWLNQLPLTPDSGGLSPVDHSLMASMGPGGMPAPALTPTVIHLHGGHTDWQSDGYPTHWTTQDPAVNGTPDQPVYDRYEQSQQAATLWYHDHAMGNTRLNNYLGSRGAYIIEDNNYKGLVYRKVLPETLGDYDTVLTLSDAAFTTDGKLYFPGANPDDPIPGTRDAAAGGAYQTVADNLPADYVERGGQYPTAMPEFFGDFVLVNGVASPFTDVEQSDYVYRLVNASDSRFYVLALDNAKVKATLLAGDGGLLRKAQVISDGNGVAEAKEQLVLAPGERVELMLNFSALAVGETAHLINKGPAFEPFKGLRADGSLYLGEPTAEPSADPGKPLAPSKEIVEFRVQDQLAVKDEFHSTLKADTLLNPNFVALKESAASKTRRIGLFEGEDQWGRVHPLLGSAEDVLAPDGEIVKAGAVSWEALATETPRLGSTEVWQVFNNTEDAHPLHLHLVEFQVLSRYKIASVDLDQDGYLNDIGAELPLYPEDAGDQDTVWIGPGEGLKLIAKWDKAGSYVYHCHILSHEDHTMMRPLEVINTIKGDNRANVINGTDGADEIVAGKGRDVVKAGLGDDLIVATAGDDSDRYDGGDGIDTIDFSRITSNATINLLGGISSSSQTGYDVMRSIENVIGGNGSDFIIGSGDANVLSGGKGNDTIFGMAGDDRIIGGAGNDRLTGGEGVDSFVYLRQPGETTFGFGKDTITDFHAGADDHDVLVIDTRMFADFAAMQAGHAISQSGKDVLLTYDALNTITLRNVSLSDLVANQASCVQFV